MRKQFVEAITPLLNNNPKSVFLTGDLGFNAFEGLRDTLGKRFINAGVAEQNMVGMAAGMAFAGLRPWVYSICPFLVLRALEQIRNDVCFHNLPVHLVGNGGGYTYGMNGATHYGLDDLGILKCLPNIQLHFPGCSDDVFEHVEKIDDEKKPSYLRLGICGYQGDTKWTAFNGQTMTVEYQRGDKYTIIGIGQAVHIALAIRDKLDADIFGVTRWPFNISFDWAMTESIDKTKKVIVIDEHYIEGSIGQSLISQIWQKYPFTSYIQMNPYYSIHHKYGDPKFMCDQVGFNPDALIELLGMFK